MLKYYYDINVYMISTPYSYSEIPFILMCFISFKRNRPFDIGRFSWNSSSLIFFRQTLVDYNWCIMWIIQFSKFYGNFPSSVPALQLNAALSRNFLIVISWTIRMQLSFTVRRKIVSNRSLHELYWKFSKLQIFCMFISFTSRTYRYLLLTLKKHKKQIIWPWSEFLISFPLLLDFLYLSRWSNRN